MRTVVAAVVLLLALPGLSLAQAAQNVLSWQDNSTNEASFQVERATAANVAACATAPTAWTQIVQLGQNLTTFTDQAVNEGTTYCYRVRAANTAGSSAYSNTAGRLVPFTIPAAPSGLQAGP